MRHVVAACVVGALGLSAPGQVFLEFVGRYESGLYAAGGSEIAAHDPVTQRLFITNAGMKRLDVVSVADPARPVLVFTISLSGHGGGVNSVAVKNGLVVAALDGGDAQDPGSLSFFDTAGRLLARVETGAMPDMVTFTPDGRYVLTANEGEPNSEYTIDPEGSVSIVSIPNDPRTINQSMVRTADFRRFDDEGVPQGVRVFGPGARPSQDIEPEYIAVAPDGRTAYVSCQEANALAVVDIATATVTALLPLGTKNHALPGNGLDASDRDSWIRIQQWPVRGYFLPDAIGAFEAGGSTFIVSANEGDIREYDGYEEERRVRDLSLDPVAFPNGAWLKRNENLGRLKVTPTAGDVDGDGDYDALYSFGARSMTIWSSTGQLVWDSGDVLERITAARYPKFFNTNNETNRPADDRSDDKGPEPEAVAIGVVNGATYAFIGLERVGGIVTFDVTNPGAPRAVNYVNSRNFLGNPVNGTAGDLGPEGLIFIPAAASPIGVPLVVAACEISGTTAIYRVDGGSGPLR